MESKNIRIVKSYNKIWKIDRRFYSIGGLNLPIPLAINFVIYYFVIALIMHLIGGILPSGIRYVVIPFGLAWIFEQKLIDGKTPYQFIRSIVIHYYIIFVKGYKINKFKYYKINDVSIKSKISVRYHKALK